MAEPLSVDALPDDMPFEEVQEWRYAPDAWRIAKRFCRGFIPRLLRRRSAGAVHWIFRDRFAAMRLPYEVVHQTMSDIHSLEEWLPAWTALAQRFLGEARREEVIGHWLEAAVARRNAAMAYHVAEFFSHHDRRACRAVRSSSAKAFAQAVPFLFPETRRVGVLWRDHALPGYLAKPPGVRSAAPLVVLLNGVTTAKEELLLWAEAFVEAGLAVLSLDWPGTGEATMHGVQLEIPDLAEAISLFAAEDPLLDPDNIALVGFSLGGMVAVQSSDHPSVRAVVTVTSPFAPGGWWTGVNDIALNQVDGFLGDRVQDLLDTDLSSAAERLHVPLLVFGAGRDVVVPPEESQRLAIAAEHCSTLVWYPDGGHGLYGYVNDWTALASRWLIETVFTFEDQAVHPGGY